ncbi:riboflavin transporter NDAI_0E00580 [Naumovozyma dairenensis CBS 421]|uniref:Major facilitator superfamily (MFS) profile domain-containing protein n=1 Tax=Naumovozyma dairenensis (strain ATCC 10597 / BCRC 20456 / CBS 421 / NBRC 0211 / NRRL Y-12639) TaxID=1071378 RepID=G0WAV4_NAUDC|nr:hypothetical protein NDAI_0E00580 [Naumovozyma dairenensis CBS 421]CCD24874.1 hypothetical protein NDAI_0E00580 [Naumovozyma dairenensis CBS 421]
MEQTSDNNKKSTSNNSNTLTPKQSFLAHINSKRNLLAYFTNNDTISRTSSADSLSSSANTVSNDNPTVDQGKVLSNDPKQYDQDAEDKDKNQLVREVTRERKNKDDDDDNNTSDSSDDSSKYNGGFVVDDGQYYPEGGAKAWTVTFACFCGLIACFGLLNATGVVENHIQNHQLADQNTSTIGWVFSLLLFTCFASCILSGTYFDRNGFKKPMIFGSILHIAGMFATANSTKLWHFFLALSVCCGIGNGIILGPLVGCPAHYFSRRRGTATAIATAGGSIGGALIPLLLRKFFSMTRPNNPDYGYMWGVRVWAFINMALLTIATVMGQERLKQVDEIDESKTEKETRWKRFVRVYLFQSFDAKGFKDPKFLFCVIGTVFGELSCCAAITYFSSYCNSHGITASDSYLLIMVINLTGIPGRWVPGYLSDILGRFNVAIGTLFVLSIVMLVGWLPFGTDLTSMYVISALYGFFSGSTFSLLPVCCGQISKTEEFGKRYATTYSMVAIATLVGIPITGAIIGDKTTVKYQHYVIFSGVTALVSCISFVISRYFCVGMKWRKF